MIAITVTVVQEMDQVVDEGKVDARRLIERIFPKVQVRNDGSLDQGYQNKVKENFERFQK